jgi:hypothetical protein
MSVLLKVLATTYHAIYMNSNHIAMGKWVLALVKLQKQITVVPITEF